MHAHMLSLSHTHNFLQHPSFLDPDLHTLDWSSTNTLAAALGTELYLWNATDSTITLLMNVDSSDYISAVSWITDGSVLAVGLSDGNVQVWKVLACFVKWEMHQRSWPENAENVQSFFLSACFVWLLGQCLHKRSTLGLQFSHVDSLFNKEEQKRVGLWCIWYFATHASLVYDVTDTVWHKMAALMDMLSYSANLHSWVNSLCFCHMWF